MPINDMYDRECLIEASQILEQKLIDYNSFMGLDPYDGVQPLGGGGGGGDQEQEDEGGETVGLCVFYLSFFASKLEAISWTPSETFSTNVCHSLSSQKANTEGSDETATCSNENAGPVSLMDLPGPNQRGQ